MSKERRILGVATSGLVLLALSGCGGSGHESHGSTTKSSGSAAETTKTVDVAMREFAYEPASLSVKAGETVKFVFHNEGKVLHDAFLGDEMAQEAHEKEMSGGGGGGMAGHDTAEAIKVDPGKTGSLIHTFKPGESLIIGCHEAGHYDAGMKLTLTVS